MKVALQVDQLFLNAPGGIGTYIRHLVPELANRDPAVEMTLFHSRFDSPEPPEPWMREHPMHELRGRMRSLYLRWNVVGRPPLPAPLAGVDIVHVTNHAGVAPAGARQRLVVTVHDLAFDVLPGAFPPRWRVVYRLGVRATVRRADAIVTPSRTTAEDLLSRTAVDPSKLHVVPLAASLPAGKLDADDVLARLKIRGPYVLFVGTLEPRKNLLRLVRAYRRVAAEGFPHALVLAGPLGWHHESLMRELALQGPGEIVMTGEISADELDAVYRAADVFAYPSLYEGFGLPVLEALVRGIPTVASNTSAVPEVSGDAALGVDPRSVRSIAQAISSLVSDVGLADRMAARARAQAQRFSWDETARLTLQVYERALGEK
ncbi:MAG TPA: glycosyltransferase family 1 protein [Actinomycetota bacterium]|jgi:glycosyltransferase involved in cell wall biosynthesis|nr:glycosyltransferase family 1 protein [Actinomycetota bacterium]